MENSHGGGIARPRRLRRANAAAAETESEEKEKEAKETTEDPGSSYEAACSADPELRTFDAALRRRAISAVASGVEVRSLSLASLRDVTGCLLDMNQEVVRVVLAGKRDVWRSPDLFDLVEAFFDGTLHTLDFLVVLDASLRRARDVHLSLQHHHRADILAELRWFRAAAASELFTADLFAAFQAVYTQHLTMVGRLRQRKRRLDGRIRSARAWRRVSGVVFAATFAALLVYSVVAAAIAAPPVAATLAAAASLPVGSAGKWVDSVLKRYQEALHGHKEVGAVVDCAEFAERDEEAVSLGVEEVKKKLEVFMKGVDDLGEQADKCSRDVRRARTVVLQKIIHPPT
ncbi:hypothetical protein PR202_gb07771 [Eleusine coracana subsp. coracana]|uniref:Uncharacterized protein n=1 Tax=Eleusine coracana subsp. coracana TaxID=191504 RepID=A0AAV5ECY7_ELECO|nr:hypothetical protein QOZ80_2BG0177000 [Eleusine coracana subsp. coracana]GJN20396.1 hypothetical protein PR202_gb07771 [Eleusine coracana subsp. coracana]